VKKEVDQKLAERRHAMIEEANSALSETESALDALEQGESQEALDALARATGKLELVVAREPDLALAPIDVDVVTYDLYATPEAIEAARSQAESLLEDGRVQEARALLSGLASETLISVTNLPLATYPKAIQAVSPLIDRGEIEAAKSALRAALDTTVVTTQVIPLPVLRATYLLSEAKAMLDRSQPEEGSESPGDSRATIDSLIAGARDQIEMAELLGYGSEADHEAFRKQIADLEAKIRGSGETEGAFARLRESLERFRTSFVN